MGIGNFAMDRTMNGLVGVSFFFLQIPYMLGMSLSFCECVVAGKEGELEHPCLKVHSLQPMYIFPV